MIPRRGWEKWRRGGTSRPRRKATSRGKERSDKGGERQRAWTIEGEEEDGQEDCAGVKRRDKERKRDWDRKREKERKREQKEKTPFGNESRWNLNFAWICISLVCSDTPSALCTCALCTHLFTRSCHSNTFQKPILDYWQLDSYKCDQKFEYTIVLSEIRY